MRLAILPYSPLWSIALLVLGYLALMLLVYLLQERFLYFPDSSSMDLAGNFGLRPWPAEENFRGFVSNKPLENSKGTFLVWHGNAGSALNRTYFTDALERRGYRVILVEYPGYCGRPGKLSEKSFISDALLATDNARNEFGTPIYLIGESLGCGVATAVVKERPWVNGVVLITPWVDLPTLAQSKFWYLPARWFVRDRYDNISNLSGYTGSVAVLLAWNDEVVPTKHGQRLFDSLKSPKRLWLFPASGHNSWPAGANEKWWDEVLNFISNSESRAPARSATPNIAGGSAHPTCNRLRPHVRRPLLTRRLVRRSSKSGVGSPPGATSAPPLEGLSGHLPGDVEDGCGQ